MKWAAALIAISFVLGLFDTSRAASALEEGRQAAAQPRASSEAPRLQANPPTAARKPMRVDFINSLVYPTDDAVWALFNTGYVKAAQAAAKQLGIVFSQHPAFRPEDMVAVAKQLANGPDRPDYLLITIHRGMGARLLEIAEQTKLPVFVINAGLLDEDRARYGGPREHYKYWIGQMLPNDEQAGYDLARLLIQRAKRDQRPNDVQVSMAALSGREVDGAAVQRNKGLLRAVVEDPSVNLCQVVTALWYRDVAGAKVPLILKRYPEVKVFWAANDAMAMGVLDGLEGSGRKPGEDIWVGGMNWDAEALHAVADGRLTATMGGHFLECVWALVLLCDHYHGIDFASERIDWRSEMRMLTRENLDGYWPRLEHIDWEKIDYRHLSKYYSPDVKTYRFSLDSLLPAPSTGESPPMH